MLDHLRIGTALRVFTIDRLLYDARLTEASRDLRVMLTQAHGGPEVQQQPPFSHLDLCLKLASVNYALNNLSVSTRPNCFLIYE